MISIKKIFIFTLSFIVILNTFSMFCYHVRGATYDEIVKQAEDFIKLGEKLVDSSSIDIEEMTKEFIPIGQILTMAGTGIIIAITIYMGIKYMTSGAEQQAKLKQQLVGLVVAAIVLFAAYPIWKIIATFVSAI